jgi:hypothetical protein
MLRWVQPHDLFVAVLGIQYDFDRDIGRGCRQNTERHVAEHEVVISLLQSCRSLIDLGFLGIEVGTNGFPRARFALTVTLPV